VRFSGAFREKGYEVLIMTDEVDEIVFGAADPKAGAVQSLFRMADVPQLNHQIAVTSGVLADECGGLLRAFFESRR
jgi:tRNA(adenine34) deaminase